MMRSFLFFFLLAVAGMLVGSALGQEPDNGSDSNDVAKRIMSKIDKDKSGAFEKDEDDAVWRRYRKLDTNRDQVISIEELQKVRVPTLESKGDRKLGIVYKQVGPRKLTLDLFYPDHQEDGAACPVVFYTHGGGWAAGSKQGIARGSFKTVFETLLDHRFAVAAVEYRLVRSGGETTIRDCVIDSKDAVRYLAMNSRELVLDRNRFFVMGDSAGGQIAQMLLLTSPEALPGDETLAAVPYRMVGGVSWYGPCDFEKSDLFNHDDREGFRDRFGPRILGPNSKPADKLRLYREMSPVNYLTKHSPPLLMIQGDKDTTIPVKHANYMKQKADSVQAPVEIMIIQNAGHNWRKVGADIAPSRGAIVERTVQFFIEQIASGRKAATN